MDDEPSRVMLLQEWKAEALSHKPGEVSIQGSFSADFTERSSETLHSHGLLAPVSAPVSLGP